MLEFYVFPEFHNQRKVAATNMLKGILREVRLRSRVFGVFPSDGA
jgi:transposase-like protein